MKLARYLLLMLGLTVCLAHTVYAEADPVFFSTRIAPRLRQVIGKPLLEQAIELNNSSNLILENLSPEGARFFAGGSGKNPGESADDLRVNHGFVVLLNSCNGVHDPSAKVASVMVWERLDGRGAEGNGVAPVVQSALGLEQLLALMNTPPGVVTPSTLRTPHAVGLHGPVFEYVRGDTTETLSMLNENGALRINWTSSNTSACPR